MDEYFSRIDGAYAHASGEALERELLDICADAAARFGPESREAASLESELGGFYRGQRDLERSEGHFRRAAEILEALGETGGDYATVINNLAGTHRLMKKWDEAEAEFSRCMELYRETVGTGSVLYASALNNLSLVKLDLGDAARARELLQESSGILARLPECRDEYAASLVNLGVLSLRCGKPEEAEKSLREAAYLMETELGTDTPHYHAAMNALAYALEAQDRPAAAENVLVIALDAARRLYYADHPEIRSLEKHLSQLRDGGQK